MNLTDVIQKTANIVGLDITIDYDNPSPSLTKLLDSARMIYSELILEHVPLKTKEKLTLTDGKGYYKDLTKPVREILSVWKGAQKLKHQIYPTFFEAGGVTGEVEVAYLFHLGEVSPEEELILPPQFTVYTMATGVASEYYYRRGMVDEALFYKTRYDYSVRNLSRSFKGATIAPRRFIW